jgi:hypothetical protein
MQIAVNDMYIRIYTLVIKLYPNHRRNHPPGSRRSALRVVLSAGSSYTEGSEPSASSIIVEGFRKGWRAALGCRSNDGWPRRRLHSASLNAAEGTSSGSYLLIVESLRYSDLLLMIELFRARALTPLREDLLLLFRIGPIAGGGALRK